MNMNGLKERAREIAEVSLSAQRVRMRRWLRYVRYAGDTSNMDLGELRKLVDATGGNSARIAQQGIDSAIRVMGGRYDEK